MSEHEKKMAEESGKYKIICKNFQEVIDIDLITRVKFFVTPNDPDGPRGVLRLWFEQKSGIPGPVDYFEMDFEPPTWLALQHFFLEDFPGI